MDGTASRSLRVLMPQWQGGNQPLYPIGAELLAWLAPASEEPLARVPVEPWHDDDTPEDWISHRSALRQQLTSARALIEAHQPDRIARSASKRVRWL